MIDRVLDLLAQRALAPWPRPPAPLDDLAWRLSSAVVAEGLNRRLAPALAAGEFDGLAGRRLRLKVSDTPVGIDLALAGRRFRARQGEPPEVTFHLGIRELLLLALGEEDPDTLFFQRRLRLEGDTALGLELRNRLDASEALAPPPAMAVALKRLLAALDRAAGT